MTKTKYQVSVEVIHHGQGEIALRDANNPDSGPLVVGQIGLFLAAPELLEAAKAILQAWQTSPKSHQSHWSDAVNKAAHAIRKTEGK